MEANKWKVPTQIWRHPDPGSTRVEVFRRWVNHKHGRDLKNYYDLHDYSVSDWTFWKDLWDFLGIVYSEPPTSIVEDIPQQDSPNWFPEARLNYAENLLTRNDDSIACTAIREHGARKHYSYRELRIMVQKMANALRANGLQSGDRVAAIVTNSIDPLIIMLATTSIGAIYSSTATDMGVAGILDRYRQIRPKFVFSETEVIYAGNRVDLIEKLTSVGQELSSFGLSAVILLPSTVTGNNSSHSLSGVKAFTLEGFLRTGGDSPLIFNQVPFSHPAFILYSSGTSGPPKCIVHTAGGVLLNSLKDYGFHSNTCRDDTYFQYTTCAWMMWNAVVNCLALGARIILYDGSPFHPQIGTLLNILATERVTHFGTSPRYLSELKGRGIEISSYGTYESLRVMFVTGAILTAPAYIWTASQFPKWTHILSGSGGTDICGGFVSACTPLNGYAGEMQVKTLGMKVEIYDHDGKNIEATGQAGELVCTRAHPSIPLGFWGDERRVKFHDAYFKKYPGVWTQGDLAVVNPLTKGIYILGRSDGVLNPGGVRFGSGEIYTVMEKFTKMVDDCVCVGQRRPQDQDERVLLFVKMRPGFRCDEIFKNSVKDAIKEALSARHVPSYIFEVAEIPYTVNNKKIEIAVKQIVSGSKIKPSGTVANPESLKLYAKYVDLEKVVAKELKARL